MAGDQLVRWIGLGDISAMELDMSGEGEASDSSSASSSMVSLRLTPDQAANLASTRLVVLAHNIYDYADDAYLDITVIGDIITTYGKYMLNFETHHRPPHTKGPSITVYLFYTARLLFIQN